MTLQLLEQRLKQFRAVGRVLLGEFDGHFINVLRRANSYLYRHDGQGFIQLLMTKFRDVFDDWPICKRPNVEALGLYTKRTQRSFPPEIDRLLNFKDIEKVVVGRLLPASLVHPDRDLRDQRRAEAEVAAQGAD